MSMKRETIISFALAGVVVSLYLVGIVSHTLLRHVVQTSPLLIAILLANRSPRLAGAASAPLFVFWLAIVILIWLFLLGIAHIVSGHYSMTERILTGTIALSTLVGIAGIFRRGAVAPVAARIGVFVVFAALQWAAFYVSIQPLFAHR